MIGITISYFFYKKSNIKRILDFYLIIHISGFYLQFLFHYILNINVDYIYYLTGEEQRTYGDGVIIPILGELYRASGFYIEPGTYATFLAPVIAIYSRYYNISILSKFIFILALISLFISFSIFGFIFFIIIIIFNPLINIKFKFTLLIVLILGAYNYIIWRFIDKVNLGGGSGFELRIDFLMNMYHIFSGNIINLMFGVGLLSADNSLNLAINDSTLLLYILYSCGIIGFLLFIYTHYLIFRNSDRGCKLAIIILLLSKFPIFAPFYSLLMGLIYYNSRARRL